MKQGIVISGNLERELALALAECEHDKLFVLADTVTAELCWPVIKDYLVMRGAKLIVIGNSDTCKTVGTLTDVWKELGDNGASRHSCLINLGGACAHNGVHLVHKEDDIPAAADFREHIPQPFLKFPSVFGARH